MVDLDFFMQDRIGSVIVLVTAIVIIFPLNVVPFLGYPFRRLFTMIHEIGHIVATEMTGGRGVGFQVFFTSRDGARGIAGGLGGNRLIIVSAGYLSIAIFSAVLMLLSKIPTGAPFCLSTVGILLILTTLVYGWRSCSTILIGFTLGGLFIWVSWATHAVWSFFLLNLLAIQGGYTVLTDLRDLGQWVRYVPTEKNDATDLAYATGCSPTFWVTIWFIMSLLIMGLAIWFTWLQPLFG